MDFIIDTVGSDNIKPTNIIYNHEPEKDASVKRNDVKRLLQQYKAALGLQDTSSNSSKHEGTFKKFFADMGWNGENPSAKRRKRVDNKLNDNMNKIDTKKVLEKSILTPEFEKLHSVPANDVSEKNLKKQRKIEREKTKGGKWFGLPATEMTDEVKNDLEVLQMRSVLDPKHFYKKNDLQVLPKYFQVGKVLDSPLDFYNSRLSKKERKKTLVDELLADAEFNKYNKRKYFEIIQERQKTHYKAYRQAKKLKRKNRK